MTDKKSNESRRKLLKSIAAGSGAIVAGKSLPENWTKPVVDSVMLSAHAQTSPQPPQPPQPPQTTRIYQSTLSADPCGGATTGPVQITNLDFDVTGITPVSLGTVVATISGDIGDPTESYTVSIEGTTLGQVGPHPSGNDNTTTSVTFNNVDLTAAAADDTITITFTPDATGAQNPIECSAPFPNTVEATLSFSVAIAP